MSTAKLAKEIKKESLGDLAGRLSATLYATQPEVTGPESPTMTSIAHYVRVELTDEEARNRKHALVLLVRERNRLIHSDLVKTDFNSIPACVELSARLDAQNDRICGQLNHLNALRQAHSEALVELRKFIESDEFLALLARDDDA